MEPKLKPETPPPQLLPVISEETRTRLIEELGLNIDPRTRIIVQNISGEPMRSPHNLAYSLTTSIFSDLMSINRDLVQAIDDELSRVANYPSETIGRTIGMGIVLRAFEVNSDFDLLSRFRNLQAEDLHLVRKIIQEALPARSQDMSILKRLLTMPRIPEQQVALNEIIQKADNYTPLKGFFPEGAAAMYQILTHLWPKLNPNQPPTQQPSTP